MAVRKFNVPNLKQIDINITKTCCGTINVKAAAQEYLKFGPGPFFLNFPNQCFFFILKKFKIEKIYLLIKYEISIQIKIKPRSFILK